MTNYKIIDADGHVRESIAGLREFIEPRWQRRNLFPNDAWDRDLRGKLGAKPEGPEDQIAAMDQDGIDVMVLYPTAGLHVGSLHERDFATAVTKAYNDWLYYFCKTNPARLKFVALLAPQDPPGGGRSSRARSASAAPWRACCRLTSRRCPTSAMLFTIRSMPPPNGWASGSVFTPAHPLIPSAANVFASFFRRTPSTIRRSR